MSNIVHLSDARASRPPMDDLAEQCARLAHEKLARRQLRLPPLPPKSQRDLEIQIDRMAELLADRVDRNGITADTQRKVDLIKGRIRGTRPTVVKFPRSRIVRTKTKQREIQRQYKRLKIDKPPRERFLDAEMFVDVALILRGGAR